MKKNYFLLDFIRGIAALLVLLNHLRAIFFGEFISSETDIIGKIFFFLAGFGHEAVIIFFVLSGFFIVRSIDQSYIKGRWSFKTYLVSRLSRLWIVLIPAILLTLIIDWLGMKYHSNLIGYSTPIPNLPEVLPSTYGTVRNFIGSIFFLQDIIVETFGSNSPLWSLAYEFWYYIIFPFIYLSYKSKDFTKRILYLFIAIGLLFFVGKTISLHFIIWLFGGAVYFIDQYVNGQKIFKQKALAYIVTFLTLIVLGGIRVKIYPVFFNNYTLGILSAILTISFCYQEFKFQWLNSFSFFISKISYTLYLIHMPIALFVISFIRPSLAKYSLNNLMILIFLFFSIIGFSYVFWWLFERNTNKVRDKINLYLK